MALKAILGPYHEQDVRTHVARLVNMLQPNVRESPAGIVDEISTKAPHVPLAHVALSTFPHLPALTPQKCIRALNLSVFNPPPAHRKVAGVEYCSFASRLLIALSFLLGNYSQVICCTSMLSHWREHRPVSLPLSVDSM